MIRQTDTWETKECGCRIQLSVWEPDPDEEPHVRDDGTIRDHMDMWVIREMCSPHQKEHDELQPFLDKFMRGEHIWDEDGNVVFTDNLPPTTSPPTTSPPTASPPID